MLRSSSRPSFNDLRHQDAQRGDASRPYYPMIIFRTPMGWTSALHIDGKNNRGLFGAHTRPTGIRSRHRGSLQVLFATDAAPTSQRLSTRRAHPSRGYRFLRLYDLRLGANPTQTVVISQILVLPGRSYTRSQLPRRGHGFVIGGNAHPWRVYCWSSLTATVPSLVSST